MFSGDAAKILGLAALSSALTGPGQTIGVSVFIDHFVDDLDLSRPQVSGAYLVGTLTGSLFLPFIGRFIDRRGVRVAQMIIGVLFAGALVNMSFVSGLLSLAIGFTGIRLVGQGSLSLVSTVTVSLRFRENRGKAIGIFSTASNALMALSPIGLAALIAAVGWRSAWLIAALIIAATVTPIAWFGLRSLPTSSNAKSASLDKAYPNSSHERSYDRGEAMRTRGFWILAAVSGSAGMLSTALNFHQIDLLTDAGLSRDAAAAMFLPQVLGSTVAAVGTGYVIDRFGSRLLPAVTMVILVSAHVLAANAAPGLAVFSYAITLGASSGAIRTVTSTLLPQWFGTAHLGSVQGTLTLLNVGASAIGPVTLALLQDRVGSYPPAILGLALIPVAALLFSLFPPFPLTDVGRKSQ
ncbi:MAG: MFS family permease [Verrucomicrobiales bacterium]|jgi:MFS family permease